MPQIKDYTAQNDVLRPSETGIESLAGAGRRAGAFYNQGAEAIKQSASDQARAAGAVANADENVARSVSGIAKSVDVAAKQAEDYETHSEISHGAATFAQLHSNLTDQWNGIVSDPKTDPNDKSIAGQFRETALEPALEDFTGSFHTEAGQNWANNHAAALRDHMFEKQSADMASLASDAVAVNVRKTTNAWSNTARNDPSSVDYLLKTADSSIAGIVATSPNLKGADAAKVHSQVTQKAKEEIIKSGAVGVAEKSGNPDAAVAAFVKRYPDYINAQEADQIAKMAKAYQRAGSADGERARRLAKEQADDKSEAQRDKYVQDIFSDKSQTTMKQVLSDPNLVPKDREHLIGVLQKEGKTTLSDEPTKTALTQRLLDPEKPTTIYDVMREHAAGKINDKDFTKLESAVKLAQEAPIQEPIFKSTMQGAEKLIGTDPVGASKHAQFMQAFLPQYLQQYRAGTLPPNALDLNDDKSMISQAMAPYRRDAMQMITDRITRGGGLDFSGSELPGGAPARPATAPVKVATPAEAAALKPGTRYVRPDGQVMTR